MLMSNTPGDQFINYLTANWLQAGCFAATFVVIIILRDYLKKNGFLTIGNILIGVVCMALCVICGWLSLIFLGFMLREHFESFFKDFIKIKIFKTTAYKTEQLLYKEDEHE